MDFRKLNALDVSVYVEKCYSDESEKDIITYWYDPKNKEFIFYKDFEREHGKYNYDVLKDSGFIPMDQLNIINFQKEFIGNIKSTELKNKVYNYIKNTKENFVESFNRMLHENEFNDLNEIYDQILQQTTLEIAINWLKKNNLSYKIKEEHTLKFYVYKNLIYKKLRKFTKLNALDVSFYVGKCDLNESEKDIATYWYDSKNKEFIFYKDFEGKYGKYNFNLLKNNGFIPMDQLNIIKFREAFIKNIKPIELKNKIQDYIRNNKEDFSVSFNMAMTENEFDDLSEAYRKSLQQKTLKIAISWLEKNNLSYKIKEHYSIKYYEYKYEIFEFIREKIRKFTKLDAFNVTFFIIENNLDVADIDNDKITVWYNLKNKEFISLQNMEKKYGKSNIKKLYEQGYLPVDRINIIQFQDEIIDSLESVELRDKMKVFIQNKRNGSFDEHYLMTEEYRKLTDIYNQLYVKLSIQKALEWLKKNNIPYKISRKYRRYIV